MTKKEMLFIPPGEFLMGVSKETADALFRDFFPTDSDLNPYIFYPEAPARRVSVPAFNISKHEVTNREFFEFVQDSGYRKKDLWKELLTASNVNTDLMGIDRTKLFVDRTGEPGPAFWENGMYPGSKADFPVEGVSWFESVAFSRWRRMRLPWEAEWEYAARGTDGRMFPWGDQMNVILDWPKLQAGKPAPVGSIAEDRSPFGLSDTARNVSEWVADTWSNYPEAPLPSPFSSDESYGVVRGGMYTSPAYQMRTTWRQRVAKLDRPAGVGFRVAQ